MRKPSCRVAGAVSATEKGGGKLEVLWVRFEAGCSPAMVYVGMSWSLGTKHGQYTLGTLYSPLANPQFLWECQANRAYRQCKKGFSSTRIPLF